MNKCGDICISLPRDIKFGCVLETLFEYQIKTFLHVALGDLYLAVDKMDNDRSIGNIY